ncbi:unnamed protein product [Strongylus vulgaris]|uniref:Uncharacterized protein n=1 Tax=Strongylus vulgaris TaxID=40348 RepID=A0A3P7LPJ5_STRVU|nr:unnamed protein product [Strongylus vulgaris]
MVEVLLVSEHTTMNKNYNGHDASDDFYNLFDEFADTHGVHYNKRHLRELELYESAADGATVGKYGARHTNCEEVRVLLSF